MTARKPPESTEDLFAAARAAKLTGLSVAMLNYLCRERIVEPSHTRRRGHGITRWYSFGDLVALRLVACLSASGVSVLRLKKALDGLRKHHPAITLTSLPATHVVTDGSDLYLHQQGEPIERLFDRQLGFAFIVELAPLRDDVVRSMHRAAKPAGRRKPVKKTAAG